jgi:predicted TPR repeat methyltransferase
LNKVKDSGHDIEKIQPGDHNYHLQKNGRYQHSAAYIEQVATQAGFTLIAHTTAQLRLEQGVPVMGDYWLYAL